MKALAVIPARSGSTRLINKNIHLLGGKPLIRWITEDVCKSKCFDKVIISTDSDDIFNAVSDLNVERHHRPSELATTESTVLNAMLDLMDGIEEHDVFAYFLPTCPFAGVQHILEGVEKIREMGSGKVVSMTMMDTIQLACEIIDDGKVIPMFSNLEQGLTNSKFLKKYYKPSGAYYMSWWKELKQDRNFFKGNVKGVLLPKRRAVDINDIHDIRFAESILRDDSCI